MIKQPASIFNDVIGPIMRGPSSSHVAAANRIGNLVRQMVKGDLKDATVEFDSKGSLATTYHGHGSDIGLVSGLLGLNPTDDRLPKSLDLAIQKGIKVNFKIVDHEVKHPNTYRMTLINDINETLHLTAISVGGGMIEIQEIEGLEVSIAGDFYETIIFVEDVDEIELKQKTEKIMTLIKNFDFCDYSLRGKSGLIDIKTGYRLPVNVIRQIQNTGRIRNIIQLEPILPIMSRKNCAVPFRSAEEMLQIASEKKLKLWELAVMYESARGNISQQEVFEKMKEIVVLMKSSIEAGLRGTSYEDRILGPQAYLIEKNKDKLIPGDVTNKVISYITSMMEVKSSMGVIVAAPTAGACGGLPGTIIGASEVLGLNIDEMTKGMLAAGIIGVFIAEKSGFAAEVGGCQVECGAGGGMAAAGLVELVDGSAVQAVDAASIALQNILGLVCDPVADRVEWPCLGRNVMAGVNAIASANMVLAGYDKVIPLDETLTAMDEVGRMLPLELRCTGLGGLSITPTSKRIYNELKLRSEKR
ncbi:L-serine ammonia-lyase, iron-sulfur-dependent, subunit alpha [Athalassotoga sp.]|uniref:L-serine ammonia-lyase, iron-sulfur-dependent, subunit alpha n=1 Tax=Athalassotoga sp. TaxID=2022597 RepID=UPI003D03BCB0